MLPDKLGLSPSALLTQVRTTFLVILGRVPAVSSYLANADGLWQAVGASVIFTILISLYPAMTVTPVLFLISVLVQLIGVLLLLLLFYSTLRRADAVDKFLPFAVPFLWIENIQQLLGGLVQNIVVLTGDQSILILIMPTAIWTIYWLWRVGRDIVGKGGLMAAGFVAMSFIIDVALLALLQSRLPAAGG